MKQRICNAGIFEKQTVQGDIFIIPNSISRLKDSLETFQESYPKEMELFGIEPEPEDQLVQVWICNRDASGDSNWNCHQKQWIRESGVKADEQTEERLALLPDYLPAELFKGKKEGDIVSISTQDFKFEFRLAQKQYRYARFGNFEEVFEHLTRTL